MRGADDSGPSIDRVDVLYVGRVLELSSNRPLLFGHRQATSRRLNSMRLCLFEAALEENWEGHYYCSS